MEPPVAPGGSKTFTVVGTPRPAGSKRSRPRFRRDKATGEVVPVLSKTGMPVVGMAPDNPETKPWMNAVAEAAVFEWAPRGEAVIDGPVFLELAFYFPRPDTHYGTGRNAGILKRSAPLYPATSGYDTDKLSRAVKDALTGIVFTNDRRVVRLRADRYFGAPRCEITVSRPAWTTHGDELDAVAGPSPELERAAAQLEDDDQLALA
jgi:Holliday junction resolvase RusA-like endonuclease